MCGGGGAQPCCPGPLLHTAVRLSVPSGESKKSGRGWDLLLALGFIWQSAVVAGGTDNPI